jgi:uncharacterized integral membrane protein
MQTRRAVDTGALVLGVILVLVGGYFLLENAFGIELPELNWDLIWPLALVALGIGIVVKALSSRSGPEKPNQP